MNSITPKGSSFFLIVMLTSLCSPRRLGGVLWLLSTTEKVSSSWINTKTHSFTSLFSSPFIRVLAHLFIPPTQVLNFSYLRHLVRPRHQCHHHLSLSRFKLKDARGTIKFVVSRGYDSISYQLLQQLPLSSDHMQLHGFPLLHEIFGLNFIPLCKQMCKNIL